MSSSLKHLLCLPGEQENSVGSQNPLSPVDPEYVSVSLPSLSFWVEPFGDCFLMRTGILEGPIKLSIKCCYYYEESLKTNQFQWRVFFS